MLDFNDSAFVDTDFDTIHDPVFGSTIIDSDGDGIGDNADALPFDETASVDKFSYGVADRGSSIRIPRFTDRDGKGYLEDRRPASNMDPYLVTSKIVETTILNN